MKLRAESIRGQKLRAGTKPDIRENTIPAARPQTGG